jgi:hypothetical protein
MPPEDALHNEKRRDPVPTRFQGRMVAQSLHAGDRVLTKGVSMPYLRTRLLDRLTATVAVAMGAGLAFQAPVARADLISLTTCNGSALSQPFAMWGDLASYELAPGGDFEKPAWTLHGAAQRVSGSEPYAATGTLGDWSLRLPAGSSAQSPPTCVDAAYPTVRFFIAGTGAVAVGLVQGGLEIPAGIAVAGGTWLPTPVIVTSSAVLATTSDGVAHVSLRLTSLFGDPQVDDIFIDPWNRG